MQKKAHIWPHEVNSINEENKYVWSSKGLIDSFIPFYEEIMKNPSSYAFRNEVDADALGIPEYKTIIKQPMALNTIKEKLLSANYSEPWDVINDFWLIFSNALLFNKPSTNVYKECVKLMDFFKEKANKLMKNLGFCCGVKYTFEPQTLACHLCDPNHPQCSISKGENYKYYKNSDNEGIQICLACFDKCAEKFKIPSDSSKLYSKSQFVSLKNNILVDETFIACSRCFRKWHSICALYISNTANGFLCDLCLTKTKTPQKEFSAERIPSTDLSEFIEDRINMMLSNCCNSTSKVIVRVLSDSCSQVKIKPEIVEHYKTRNITSFPYRSKAIYAFQKIDGYDVAFFALYTQEYNETCPAPNSRRIYISYLDSVYYFRPRELKTEVYRTILISYLDYCRQQQYLTAHLWSCPPGSGDDYVFHQHPSEQKVPKKNRLIKWYKDMLNKAVLSDVVIEYMNIYEFFIENRIVNPIDIPYFDGDFWPNAISEMLSTGETLPINQDAKKRKIAKKKTDSVKDVHSKMLQMSKRFNEEFLVIVLNRQEEVSGPIINIDRNNQLKNTALVEVRDSILYFCREFNLEFSSLRRAKFTTMRILDELFRDNQKDSFDCDVCKKPNLSDRYTCKECLDFDLCPVCYDKWGHEHHMNRVFLSLNEISLRNMLRLLYDTMRCMRCRENNCVRMKTLITHAQCCKLSYKECKMCYIHTYLMVNHVHYCKNTNCRIPLCQEKQDKEKRRQSQILLKRRYNEILRYQATKQSLGEEFEYKPEISKITTEQFLEAVKQFKVLYPDKNECKRQFQIFLESNPNYYLASNEYLQQQKHPDRGYTQLGGKLTNKSLSNSLQSNQNDLNKKPEIIVEKKQAKSDYFIRSPKNYKNHSNEVSVVKPLPKNHVRPVESMSVFCAKPQTFLVNSTKVEAEVRQDVPLRKKKKVEISNQN